MQADQSDLFSSGTTTPTTEHVQQPISEVNRTRTAGILSDTPELAIYIAGHSPLQLPLNASFSEFNDLVADILDWGNKFLLYRPASGSKQELTWRAISIAKDYEKLLKTCGHVGVLVKVVEDSWFDSEAQSEVCSNLHDMRLLISLGRGTHYPDHLAAVDQRQGRKYLRRSS